MNDKQPDPVTLDSLQSMKQHGEKIACLTTYDASFTRVLEACGVDMFIIGDSLGMVLMGYESTVPVTMDDMVHHAANVARVGRRCYRVVDLPAHSYDDPVMALKNARRLVDEGGAHMVKLEGGVAQAGTVQALVDYGIPVCGHVGCCRSPSRKPAATRCKGGTRRRPVKSLRTPRRSRRPARACW